jgi:membrane associated rhomboid family serine protease
MAFRGAPITLCLCSTLVVGTFLAGSIPKVHQALALESAASVLAPHRAELWRLLTSSLCLCDNLVAAGVSAYLLFHLRFFERQLGSSKFGAYVTLSTLADMGARAAFLALPGGVGALGVASGPLHLIFGLLPLYFRAWGRLAARPGRGGLWPPGNQPPSGARPAPHPRAARRAPTRTPTHTRAGPTPSQELFPSCTPTP